MWLAIALGTNCSRRTSSPLTSNERRNWSLSTQGVCRGPLRSAGNCAEGLFLTRSYWQSALRPPERLATTCTPGSTLAARGFWEISPDRGWRLCGSAREALRERTTAPHFCCNRASTEAFLLGRSTPKCAGCVQGAADEQGNKRAEAVDQA